MQKNISLLTLCFFVHHGAEGTAVDISLLDVHGKMVTRAKEQDLSQNRSVLDVGRLSSGVYFLKIKRGATVETRKVLVF